MNDGGLNENIDKHVGALENELPRPRRFENDKAHLDPSRWWFASSAFPMIAATLGPVASAFSICSLVRPWRQNMKDTTITADPPPPFIPDPSWLLIVNAIQLVMAVISNVFLLLNMAKRVRFSIAQPITIVGWYVSSICLIALNATAFGPLVYYPIDEFVWSQAFWYGMWAAILYFVVATLMVVTVYGARAGHYSKEFQLTNSQRTLMLQTILFLMYMLVGALLFSHIEDWPYLDAVYWADVTLFTVGFGDFAASTALGRALLFPYAFVGVISLGLVIGSVRSMVLERGRRKLNARMVEKKRRKLVKAMTKKGHDEILKPIRGEENPELAARLTEEKLRRDEYERRQAEFNLMRQIQYEASLHRRWVAMGVSTGSWLVLWLVGAKIFMEFEKPYQQWTYFEGFYFTFVTLTTIGYGDRTPVSNGGKSFFVFWSLLALPTMTVLISNAGDTVVKGIRDATLSLGNITILPGERGFKTDIKGFVHSLSCGILFKENVRTAVPGFHSNSESLVERPVLNDSSRNHSALSVGVMMDEEFNSQDGRNQQDEENPPQLSAPIIRRSLSAIRDANKPLPSNPTEFHYILISEIAAVTQDMKAGNNKRYSFDEWAWYLKLIGEDESNADTHRKARPNLKKAKPLSQKRKSFRRTFTEKLEEEGEKWSWVGSRSPLMGSVAESEWILERLTQRLREELAAVRREEITAETGKSYEEDGTKKVDK